MHLKMGKLVTFVYFITIKKLGKQNKKLRLLILNMGLFPTFYTAPPCKGL